MKPIRGSCLCAAVRYEITGSFKVIGNCHCSICRKSHGAAFATWGILDPEQFRWTSGEEFVAAYESSPGRERCFCRRCGSALVCRHAGAVGEVVVGTIDGDPGGRPSEHIFVGSKASWHDITDPLPQHEGWPPSMES
jgi:hypothetical protein